MTHTQLIAEPIKYEPYFDYDTHEYIDKSPWKKNYRGNRKEYKCPCKSYIFSSTLQFNQHIKCKVHKKWLINYEKETKEIKEQEKELRIENEKLKKQLKKNEIELNNCHLLIKLLQEKLKNQEEQVLESEQDKFYDTNETNEID